MLVLNDYPASKNSLQLWVEFLCVCKDICQRPKAAALHDVQKNAK